MKISRNLYEILNISPDSSIGEMKTSFHKLALIHHPDKNNNSPESHLNFQIIYNAYNVLISPEKRKEYDLYLKTSSVIKNKYGNNSDNKSSSGDKINYGWSLENLFNQFNFILWEIEDILNLTIQINDPTQYGGLTIQQWLLKILIFIDRWVLEPAGFIDYFYEARKMGNKKVYDFLNEGFSSSSHQPYTSINDYFYDIRKRMDKFIKSVTIQDVLKTIEGYNVKLIDSIFEAQMMAYHYLGSINLIVFNESSSIVNFHHSDKCYEDDYTEMLEFRE